ncbi:SDR family NAD(P)-dependent oxidoreductase [Robiginitalea sp. SC105]|uniref:SDR family NAD(P)-dependent oxidoreductase n=1 Tax=Robiginitalea sp. SC105 TaxID=2762332 RepID=UPI00163952FB|nr:SDR family oxidoreductase [Robiginitalea sp. SC105]MBC2838130.1 SDR family oxidoreductase [Robiginitalea sp. SC105]
MNKENPDANPFGLNGKVAIVTGSSKGIGRSIALGLARQGARVVVSSRDQAAVDTVAEDFHGQGLEALAVACHVADAGQRENLVRKTLDAFGRIDILVNNAGINPAFGPLEGSEEAVFDKVMAVNTKAPWLLCNLVLPHLKKQGKGSIINVSSVGGIRPGTGLGLYCMSKAALIMLTKSQAREWGPYGIRANVLCPGLVRTKISEGLWSDEKTVKGYNRSVPLGRIAEPDEMAGAAVLLASDAGSYMTGGVYTADGGFLVSG